MNEQDKKLIEMYLQDEKKKKIIFVVIFIVLFILIIGMSYIKKNTNNTTETENTNVNDVTTTNETNQNGQIIEQVPDVTYTITEIKAPEGYSINKEPQTCTVSSADETSKEVTITDDKLKDPVHIYGNLGEDYNTSEYIEIELQGYTLEVDENNEYVIPDNATGTFGENVIHVNYYYEKTTNLSITK